MIETGTILQDRFLIEDRIGEGGMGAVYLVVDQKFGSRVAIKETFFADAGLAEAFEREARLLNGLHHPLFPHVSDHFTENGGNFLVMEYIEGEDLSVILKRGEMFAMPDIMRWTLDLLDGLDYLHSQDPPIIHRDIKPNNLKLTSRGNIVLLDFGMAKETSGTTEGMKSVFGYSRRYSPLEQIEGTGTDVRSDIFSLGATVYHLLTGKPPVDVLARVSALVAGQSDPLQLAEISGRVSPGIAAIIDSALALNANQRFISAKAMRSALEHALKSESELSEQVAIDGPLHVQAERPAAAEIVPALTPELDKPTPQSRYQTVVAAAVGNETARVPEQPTQIRIRKPLRSRAALWALALLGCLAVVGFGIYRAGTSSEIVSESPQTTEAVTPETTQAESSDEQAAPESGPERTSTVTDKPQPKKEAKAVNAAVPAKADSDQTQKAEIEIPEPPAKPKLPERRRINPTINRSPPSFERESSASDIESVLNGIPSEEDRIWEAEQRRRRKMRRIQRENRRYPPPF
ncbi:MAG: protein kinase [Pyrinomonadaceae bacterium]